MIFSDPDQDYYETLYVLLFFRGGGGGPDPPNPPLSIRARVLFSVCSLVRYTIVSVLSFFEFPRYI